MYINYRYIMYLNTDTLHLQSTTTSTTLLAL